jgi:Ca2+-binding EF-hand superfamily protein
MKQDVFSKKLYSFPKVDQVQVNQLYHVFMKISEDGKKPLNKEKFKEGLGMLQECGLKNLDNTPFIDVLFTQLDRNKDGTIDLYEFISGLSVVCKGTFEEKIARILLLRSNQLFIRSFFQSLRCRW